MLIFKVLYEKTLKIIESKDRAEKVLGSMEASREKQNLAAEYRNMGQQVVQELA
jgi:hypothetical protein